MRLVPEIETQRLILRGHRVDDLTRCQTMWADEITTRFTTGRPSTEQQTWMRILSYLGHWSLMGYGYWAIEEKKSSHYIGELGFADFHRELNPSIKGLPEMGWALTPSVHGQRYAVEAMTAALAWGDQYLPAEKTVCIIHPENERSIKLAERFGFRPTAETKYMGAPVTLFSRSLAR